MNWLLILVLFGGGIEMKFVTKQQCLGAVDILNSLANDKNAKSQWPCAICLPPDVAYAIENDKGGSQILNFTGQCILR